MQKLQMQFKTEVQIELDNDVIETLYKGKYLNKEQIITTLKNHQANFKQLGVVRLALFGSVARNEARTISCKHLSK
jgi:hypothetical protein